VYFNSFFLSVRGRLILVSAVHRRCSLFSCFVAPFFSDPPTSPFATSSSLVPFNLILSLFLLLVSQPPRLQFSPSSHSSSFRLANPKKELPTLSPGLPPALGIQVLPPFLSLSPQRTYGTGRPGVTGPPPTNPVFLLVLDTPPPPPPLVSALY